MTKRIETKAVKRKSRTPANYVPKKHYRGATGDTVPIHRLPLVGMLEKFMGRAGFSMLQLNNALGYQGRSGVSMIMSGHRGLPLSRVDDFAKALGLDVEETERLREAAVHASSSPEAFELFLQANHRPDQTAADATRGTSSSSQGKGKAGKRARVLFRG